MIWLNDDLEFPDYSEANEDGILALGGDLNPKRLFAAYRRGIFPWFNEGSPIIWWFPNPRFVLFPEDLRVSKSMKKIFRDQEFSFTENECFREVMSNCQSMKREGQAGTWITEEMLEAYVKLHEMGFAKSFEVWKEEKLVGGFYGIDLGNVFCGESMFSKFNNASKAGFIQFVQQYKSKYNLIDCQVYTSHLASLGAIEIKASDFVTYLPK